MWCPVFWMCFGFSFLQYYSVNGTTYSPVVTLSTGQVQGLKNVSALGRVFYSFRGIPYAEPPVGELRFKAPIPKTNWTGTLQAFNIPPACPQPKQTTAYPETYSEDCLHLNVFTPYLQPPGGNLMPVIVLIYGGDHYKSSSSPYMYGPDFFMIEDLVLLTFNYRLGPLGYLNAHTRSAPGNAGQKDLIAVLRWVQKEISEFGGDPGSVTVYGGSSAGNDVNCLNLSPMAQGLFHRAVSYCALPCGTELREKVPDLDVQLARKLQCPVTDPEQMVACLQNVPWQDIVDVEIAGFISPQPYIPTGNNSVFSITIEEDFGQEIYMGSDPHDLLEASTSTVPYMIGLNNRDGIVEMDDAKDDAEQLARFMTDFEYYVLRRHPEIANQKNVGNIGDRLKQFYFEGEPLHSTKGLMRYMDFMMDNQFSVDVTDLAVMTAIHAPVYIMFFSFHGHYAAFPTPIFANISGARHEDELAYLFYQPLMLPTHDDLFSYPLECLTMTRMVRLFSNFAKYGNPTPDESDSLLNVTWLPVNGSDTRHLVINDILRMESRPLLEERMAFWHLVYNLAKEDESHKLSVTTVVLVLLMGLVVVGLTHLVHRCFSKRLYQSL